MAFPKKGTPGYDAMIVKRNASIKETKKANKKKAKVKAEAKKAKSTKSTKHYKPRVNGPYTVTRPGIDRSNLSHQSSTAPAPAPATQTNGVVMLATAKVLLQKVEEILGNITPA